MPVECLALDLRFIARIDVSASGDETLQLIDRTATNSMLPFPCHVVDLGRRKGVFLVRAATLDG